MLEKIVGAEQIILNYRDQYNVKICRDICKEGVQAHLADPAQLKTFHTSPSKSVFLQAAHQSVNTVAGDIGNGQRRGLRSEYQRISGKAPLQRRLYELRVLYARQRELLFSDLENARGDRDIIADQLYFVRIRPRL